MDNVLQIRRNFIEFLIGEAAAWLISVGLYSNALSTAMAGVCNNQVIATNSTTYQQVYAKDLTYNRFININ